jgi:radical SAM protein with 4Fe4S-binding SPASM domain
VSKRIPLFPFLEIETSGDCNRTCGTCIRNSHPDRDAVSSWFGGNALPTGVVLDILHQARDLGFTGPVNLSHYNEPMLDSRLALFGRTVKALGFSGVMIVTNGDLITAERAAELDGVIDHISVSLYMPEPVRSKREAWLRSLFRTTAISMAGGVHIPTHFSPGAAGAPYAFASPVDLDAAGLAERHRRRACDEPTRRMVINHRGDMLLCCDDLTGHFDLGNVNEQSLEALWFSERHQQLIETLLQASGRAMHPWCASCPRS